MHISKRQVSASIAALFIAAVAAESFATAQAQPKGYIQADCPNIVKQAIDTVSAQCGKTARGKLCYGNSNITAEFQPGANNIQFNAPGDTVDVNALKQFTLGGMDTAANSWGVAEMEIKADLPDSDPSQAVTMILFGDVQLTDASNDASATAIAQTPGAVVRQNQQATSTANAINQQATKVAATATKIAGLEATATARALTPTATGTISAAKATQAAATATKLAAFEQTATVAAIAPTVVPGAGKGLYSGLQAFYFQSNDTAPCDQAPHDGILIQSPQGTKRRVTLNIDGATISLGSTVYITAQPGKFLTINTLEGSAIVTAAGRTATAVAGSAIQVPLDATVRAIGVPVATDFYTDDTVRALPTGALPSANIIFVPGFPSNSTFSNWTETETITSGVTTNCSFSNKNTIIFQSRIGFNQSTMWYKPYTVLIILSRSATNTYSDTENHTYSNETDIFTIVVNDQNHVSGTITGKQDDGSRCDISLEAIRNDSTAVTPTAAPTH